jgi:CHRD domain
MPAGTVTFGRHHGRLTVHAAMFGLTPGSSHNVNLVIPGRFRAIRFSPLTANSAGQADSTLRSHFAGHPPRGSRLLIRMGVGGGRVARERIAETGRLSHPGRRPHRLIAVEVRPGGISFGTPRGRAAISYRARRRTLTVTVSASGVTPGPHAAHIHLGSCGSQGPVKYMLRDLVADRNGRIAHATRVFTNVTAPIPASGWYLNIHQGNSGNILSGGQPTIFFRPLLCADIGSNGSILSILRTGDIVTGVRGTGNGNVVLTGSATGSGAQTAPFLYRGRLTGAAAGAAVSVLTPRFPRVTSATFYGPDTHSFNPASIRRGRVRAVGSYQSSSAPAGVVNQGMIYLGPVNGPGGSWTSIDVPAHGTHTAGHARACPRRRARCFVMDTIAHSTMGNLVVGNYDLNPTVAGGVASGNAFIYNLTRHQWTLLRLGGSMSNLTTLYGIWQDGGGSSPRYTLAGGSSDRGNQRAFLMNYNEMTGIFGKPKYFSYRNAPALFTHFDGITAVRGGFNLVAISSAQASSMASIPVKAHGRWFGPAKWHPIHVARSQLCSGGCSKVTGNTVYRNHVMGIYLRTGSAGINSYLATVARR